MQRIRQLLNDDDSAVSPVIGVILMVAITVILAAVIASFVLGLGDSAEDPAPTVSADATWDDDIENVTITIDTMSESVDADEMFLRGPVMDSEEVWEDFSPDEVNAGSSITIDNSSGLKDADDLSEGEDLRLVFDDGDSSDTLVTFEVPASYVDD